ncbi:hypothetical protein EF901_15175 [Staphylococcus aureus]|nr:hypothetical protein EF901_15175 [Staphylococcus aureus]
MNRNLFDNIESFLNNKKIKKLPDNTKMSVADDYDLGDLRTLFNENSDEFKRDSLTTVEYEHKTMTTDLDIDRLERDLWRLYNFGTDVTPAGKVNADVTDDALIDIEMALDEIHNKFKPTTIDKNRDLTHLIDNIGKLELPYPHIRKRRKQWAGKPTYRTATEDINVNRLKGYSMRSMLRHYPKIEPYDHRKKLTTLARSISHIQLWKSAKVTPFETVKSRFEVDLYDAHVQLCYFLFEHLQENTTNRKDAWDMYLPSGLLEKFIEDNYVPTVKGFGALEDKMSKFIASAWDTYEDEARVLRESRYGMDLTSEDVEKLKNADTSIFKTKIW